MINTIRSIRRYKVEEDLELYHAFDIGQIAHKKCVHFQVGLHKKVGANHRLFIQSQSVDFDEPTAGLDPLAADILKEKNCQRTQIRDLYLSHHIY